MGNDIRDSTGTNEEHSSFKLLVYSTFISKLDKTTTRLVLLMEFPPSYYFHEAYEPKPLIDN